jgi:hypothetical protein
MGAYGGGFVEKHRSQLYDGEEKEHVPYLRMHHFYHILLGIARYIFSLYNDLSHIILSISRQAPACDIHSQSKYPGTAVDRQTGSGETPSESAPETETPVDGYLG